MLKFIVDNSLLLIAGAVTALAWANLDLASYEHAAHAIHFAVNDIGMVFFFALAMKEVVEAMRPGGALSTPRQAGLPILAAVGGMESVELLESVAQEFRDKQRGLYRAARDRAGRRPAAGERRLRHRPLRIHGDGDGGDHGGQRVLPETASDEQRQSHGFVPP